MRRYPRAPLRLRNLPIWLRLRSSVSTGRFLLVAALVPLAFTAISASASPLAASARALRVSYLNPGQRLSGLVTLRASASTRGARVVAVTFLFDGQPLGSDTTRPYRLEIDAGALRPGSHRLRVAAADSLGRRVKSRAIPVTVVAHHARSLVASPRRGLKKALARLSRGGVSVRLLPGHYELSEVSLGSNTRLSGSGRSTVISAPSGSYEAILLVKGRHVQVSDLVLDGSGPGPGDGQAVEVRTDVANVRISHLEIKHVRQTGVYVWGSYHDVSVQDSVIAGDKRAEAGVVFQKGDSGDSSVIRTRVSGFRSYGIDFSYLLHDPSAAPHAVALDNVVTDIADPAAADGRSECGIWSGGVEAALVGNVIKRTGWDGIETVGSSRRLTIVANTVTSTQTGIYLEHSTNNSLIRDNRISNVDRGINVEWRYDGIGSSSNSFIGNTISAAEQGISVDVGDNDNRIKRNVFLNVSFPVTLRGSSKNIVRGNRACRVHGALVTESKGLRDDGTLAASMGNSLSDNLVRPCSKLETQRR